MRPTRRVGIFFSKEMSIAAGFVLAIKRRPYTTDKNTRKALLDIRFHL